MIDTIRKTLYLFYLKVNKGLGITEKWYADRDFESTLHHRPIFILGAPRCGSTLLYQSLTTSFDVGFISNAHCLLHGAPWLVEFLLHPAEHYKSSSYQSKYGSTKGAYAPSECGEFWYRFFPKDPQYAPLEKCDSQKLKKLRISFRAMNKAANKPILIKNIVNVLRLQALLHTLPEALFIVLERNERDIAHSILESRQKRMNSYETWFSLEPPNIEELKSKPVVQQVMTQIRSSYELIRNARQQSPEKFYTLSYEEFCESPERELKDIESFFSYHDMNLPLTGPIPEPFERRSEIRIDKNLYTELLQHLENQNKSHE